MSASGRSTSDNNPDMADVLSPTFGFSLGHMDQTHQVPHKRKRAFDDLDAAEDDAASGQDFKRRSFHALPIRLSPSSRPPASAPSANLYSTFTSIYQQPPTPVDTSEDESPSIRPSDSRWLEKPSAFSASRCSSNASMASLKAQPVDSTDVDMDLALTPVLPRIRRARSNDIVPPHRELLGAIDAAQRESPRDRVPTPISSHFENRLVDLPVAPRHSFPPLRTNLSPMIEQESWIGRDGLPSPLEDTDMDGVMMVDSANDGMHGLTVGEHVGGSVTESPSRRTARLHMGYLSGCEKCEQKVPGHYSHILWS